MRYFIGHMGTCFVTIFPRIFVTDAQGIDKKWRTRTRLKLVVLIYQLLIIDIFPGAVYAGRRCVMAVSNIADCVYVTFIYRLQILVAAVV